MIEFYAHSRERDGKTEYQTVKDHAIGVAELVKAFSEEWCDGTLAENLGLLHDIGKYQPSFQKRILGSELKVEHSNCGAKEWTAYCLPDAAPYLLAGHHAGLPDIGARSDPKEKPTLRARLKRNCEDYSVYKQEICLKLLSENTDLFRGSVQENGERGWKEYAFWTRMMFSCLADADFLDTETYCAGEQPRGITADFEACARLLDEKFSALEKNAQTAVNRARQELRRQIMAHTQEKANIYYMNLPTGSGKTLASMRFALERALIAHKKHIIYVIPYTSIIEQNARVFKDIFGDNAVLEHHCNFDFLSQDNRGEGGTTGEKLLRSAENWDASIIVTTNVRFFESIYSNRTSALRRLHNMADSILVFDEVHMFPSDYFQPCLEAIRLLTTRYGCEAIFLSATMPDFDNWLHTFKCDGLRTCNLIDDTSCYAAFERCRISDAGELSKETLLARAQEAQNALIVVNTRKSARELYAMYSGKKYHLSTYMTHYDRSKTIQAVQAALETGERFILFSTSLIEAGVDLDFDTVFREQAGLDNLLQTAGRCNRNGKKDSNACMAYSFRLEGENGGKGQKVQRYYTGEVFAKFAKADAEEAIRWYFDKLFADQSRNMSAMDFLYAKGADGTQNVSLSAKYFAPDRVFSEKFMTEFNFAGYAQAFHLIDENSRSLVIVDSRNREEVNQLLIELGNGKSAMAIKRKLQKYTVSLRDHEWKKLMEAGAIALREGIALLANENYYHPDTGLSMEDTTEYYFS